MIFFVLREICAGFFFQGLKPAMRDLVLTQKGLFLIGREVEKAGPNKAN